jgi:hypothetical protein
MTEFDIYTDGVIVMEGFNPSTNEATIVQVGGVVEVPERIVSATTSWTAVTANVVDGNRVVEQVVDWIGGSGAKPAVNVYKGTTGFVTDIAQATNVRGLQGIQGIPGTNGTNGANGATWRSSTGAPSNALGVDGDFYLDIATGNQYKKDAGSYALQSNLKGATGEAGKSAYQTFLDLPGNSGKTQAQFFDETATDPIYTSFATARANVGLRASFRYGISGHLLPYRYVGAGTSGEDDGARTIVSDANRKYVLAPITGIADTLTFFQGLNPSLFPTVFFGGAVWQYDGGILQSTIGTQGVKYVSPGGSTTDSGAWVKQDTPWRPIPARVADGARIVEQVVDWVDGTGVKPPVNVYIGSTGYVTDIALATDIRGAPGSGTTDTVAASRLDALEAVNLAPDPRLIKTTPGVNWFSFVDGTMRTRWVTPNNATKTSSGFTFTGSASQFGYRTWLDELDLVANVDTVTGAWLVAVADTAQNRSVRVRLFFYNAAGTLISSTTPGYTTVGTTPQVLKNTAVLPALTVSVGVMLEKQGGGTPTSQNVLLTGLGFTKGSRESFATSPIPMLKTSEGRLKEWTLQGAFEFTSLTYRPMSNRVSSAGILWPDGSAGTLTYTFYNERRKVFDGYKVTHIALDKTVTQPPVTRLSNGRMNPPPALVVTQGVL